MASDFYCFHFSWRFCSQLAFGVVGIALKLLMIDSFIELLAQALSIKHLCQNELKWNVSTIVRNYFFAFTLYLMNVNFYRIGPAPSLRKHKNKSIKYWKREKLADACLKSCNRKYSPINISILYHIIFIFTTNKLRCLTQSNILIKK